MDHSDLLQKFYFFEIERKSKLQTGLSLPIGVLAFSVALSNYGIPMAFGSGVAADFSKLLVGGIVLSLVYSLYELALFLVGKRYRYIWSASQFREHFRELQQFFKRHPDSQSAEAVFADHFHSDLAGCATHNSIVNDDRAARLWRINIATLVIVVCALFLSAIKLAAEYQESLSSARQSDTTTTTSSSTTSTSSAGTRT